MLFTSEYRMWGTIFTGIQDSSKDNSRWQTERCSDDRNSQAYILLSDLALQTIPPGAKVAMAGITQVAL